MMKSFIVNLLLTIVLYVKVESQIIGPIYDLDKAEELFETYTETFKKHYDSADERHRRFENFYTALKNMNRHNSNPRYKWIVYIDDFSDWTEEELESYRIQHPFGLRPNIFHEDSTDDLTDEELKDLNTFALRENVLKQLTAKGNLFENSRSYRSEIKPYYDMSKSPQYFQSYIDKFNKQYASTTERDMRFGIFYHTLEDINAINSDPTATWTADLNKFSDWTEEELDQLLGYEKTENKQNGPIYDLNRAEEYFENFIKEHDRHYDSLAEKNMRFEVFYSTLKSINSVNSDPAVTWTADINDFADWTDEELKELLDFITPLGNIKKTTPGVIGASELFKLYTEKFNKYYSSPDERDMRFGIFYNTLAKVNEINSDPMNTVSAVLNKYSDRTEEELHALFGSETMDQKPKNGPTYFLNNAKELFEKFIRMFGRNYDSLAEKLMRFAIFYDTLKNINFVNSDPTEKWYADINDYSDWTDDELMNLPVTKK